MHAAAFEETGRLAAAGLEFPDGAVPEGAVEISVTACDFDSSFFHTVTPRLEFLFFFEVAFESAGGTRLGNVKIL